LIDQGRRSDLDSGKRLAKATYRRIRKLTFQSLASRESIIGSSGSLISPESSSSTFLTFSWAWIRSSSEKVRLCRARRACARKWGPTGSILRCVAAESFPIALKSFSPDQPSGRIGKGRLTCVCEAMSTVQVSSTVNLLLICAACKLMVVIEIKPSRPYCERWTDVLVAGGACSDSSTWKFAAEGN